MTGDAIVAILITMSSSHAIEGLCPDIRFGMPTSGKDITARSETKYSRNYKYYGRGDFV